MLARRLVCRVSVPSQVSRPSQALLRRMTSTSKHSDVDVLSPGGLVVGQSGRQYIITEILARRDRGAARSVYRAKSAEQSFIIKVLLIGALDYQKSVQDPFLSHPNIRTYVDVISDSEAMVFPYLKTDLLRFSQKVLSVLDRRAILRDILTGIAALHKHNIYHSDIKPNNVVIDYDEIDGRMVIGKVQLTDLDDAVQLEEGAYCTGALCGNEIWRATEVWGRDRQGLPSDMFSFAMVAIYVMMNQMVLHRADNASPEDLPFDVLSRHISYFADSEGFQGLWDWLAEDNQIRDTLLAVIQSFMHDAKREPFRNWTFVDSEFRDFIGLISSVAPLRRGTAEEALRHPWMAKKDSEVTSVIIST